LSPSSRRTSTSSSDTEEDAERAPRSSYASKLCVLPSMHTLFASSTKGGIKYVESNKILDEFVGVVLNYANHNIAVNP
jgi:hypothetical protein